MKRFISSVLVICVFALLLAGCGEKTEQKSGISIVTTIFPIYDWVKNVAGDAPVNIKLLAGSGVDLHSYQPGADDIISIASCDLFIYVGGESDKWVDDALNEGSGRNRTVLDLIDVLGSAVLEEEEKEGMQAEEGEEEEGARDEHVWLSLRNASVIVKAISADLSKLDPEHADTYAKNAESYTASLAALDEKYVSAVADAKFNTLLVCDRFPFRYMTEDYGLEYYAAFAGCSAESEASFETIAFLAEKLTELGLNRVITLEGSSGRIAETVISASGAGNAGTVTLDSMQSTDLNDIKNGASYLSVMEKNLQALTEALS